MVDPCFARTLGALVQRIARDPFAPSGRDHACRASMKTLVTGGAGFIGSHIVCRLVEDGHDVTVLDNFSSGKRDNLAPVAKDVRIVEADVCDANTVCRLSEGRDVVFHEAAIVSVPYSVEHPERTHEVNIRGTLNVLLAARRSGVRRVVFASSAAVYGEDPTLPKVETMLPEPISPYGVEKLTAEHYLRTFSRLYEVETVALRYFNVFGPRQDPSSPYSGVISVFASRIVNGQPIDVFGDGLQTRDFVYVANVVDANMAAASAKGANGGIYNIACGKRTTLLELADAIGGACGRTLEKRFRDARPGDVRDSLADIGRAREALGYAPRVGLHDGLRRLLEHEARASEAR
jgi:nucleoside-diphosphate-sugar epimerase